MTPRNQSVGISGREHCQPRVTPLGGIWAQVSSRPLAYTALGALDDLVAREGVAARRVHVHSGAGHAATLELLQRDDADAAVLLVVVDNVLRSLPGGADVDAVVLKLVSTSCVL